MRDQFHNYRVECHADYEGAAEQKDKGAQKGSQCFSFKRLVLIHAMQKLILLERPRGVRKASTRPFCGH